MMIGKTKFHFIDLTPAVTKKEVDKAAQLLLFVLELKVTVSNLVQIPCTDHCKKLLPPLSNVEWLVKKLDEYCCDLRSAYRDGVSALPTKFNFGYFDALSQTFVEQTITFCFVHTARKHQFKTTKQAADHVSLTVLKPFWLQVKQLLRNVF